MPARITGDSDNGFDVEYTPTETGQYVVIIFTLPPTEFKHLDVYVEKNC